MPLVLVGRVTESIVAGLIRSISRVYTLFLRASHLLEVSLLTIKVLCLMYISRAALDRYHVDSLTASNEP
jgi:hypothetical protein